MESFDDIILPAHANPIVLEWLKTGKAKIVDSGCWEWQGGKVYGYGKAWINNQSARAHRIAISANTGLVAAHSCDNRSCVNPNHLRQTSQKSNMEQSEKMIKGNNNANTKADSAESGMIWTPRQLQEQGEWKIADTPVSDPYSLEVTE